MHRLLSHATVKRKSSLDMSPVYCHNKGEWKVCTITQATGTYGILSINLSTAHIRPLHPSLARPKQGDWSNWPEYLLKYFQCHTKQFWLTPSRCEPLAPWLQVGWLSHPTCTLLIQMSNHGKTLPGHKLNTAITTLSVITTNHQNLCKV